MVALLFFRHPGESRDPGVSGKVPNMWPLDSGFRRNDGRILGLPQRWIDYLKGSFSIYRAR
jgi:hypothetical protein